jgi:hypothetical protein
MTSAAVRAITRVLFIGVLLTINRKDLMLTLLRLMATRRRHSQPLPRSFTLSAREAVLFERWLRFFQSIAKQ